MSLTIRSLRRPHLARHAPPGFTLAELMISLVLLGLVGGTIMTFLIRQQRFFTNSSEVIETRASVRQAADLLSTELRALSPESGDIYAMDMSGIEYRAVRGTAIVCNLLHPAQFVVPPVALSRRNGLSNWAAAPVPGDSVLVLDVDATPRVWLRGEIAAVGGGSCLAAADYTASASENDAGLQITLVDPLPSATLITGAAVRFYRRASYRLYQAADGRSYLGYRDCLPTRVPQCETIQPVSGPYLPNASAETGGLVFRYFDETGAETAVPDDVVRMDVTARAASRNLIPMSGGAPDAYRDSLAFSIAARN